ncbi:helix-turn-helix domain-containing protein [Atopococcus tabaci]|uniref:helix-turn-helix domain-containing protein n=1 Tax=Atopococcus tabaci TaxID=269774 RepID=UPI0004871EB3|nr:helix-turn-helix transcriptional regulator [Atopococcus tabaci]
MGETLKMIRTSLSLTQSQLSAGIMTQSNYSKMEKGEIDVPFSKMIALLEKLGMSVEEFLYVHNHYSQQSTNHLLRLSRLKYNDKERLVQYKKELVSQSTMTTRE